jgi:hypothetical protein
LTKTIHEFRTIKLKEGLVESIEKFLDTTRAKKLGITTITDAVDYFCKNGIDKL